MKRSNLIALAGLCVPLGTLLAAGDARSDGQATVLHVQGMVRYVTYHGAAADVRVERSFEVWANGCESYARLNSGSGPDAGPFRGFEVYCHADHVALATIYDSAQFGSQAPAPNRARIVTNQVVVSQGPIPFGGLSQVTPVWFAYASDCYLRSLERGEVRRFYTMSQAQFELKDDYVRMVPVTAASPGIGGLDRVAFCNTGKALIPTGGGGYVEKTCLKPYDHGYVEAVYEVSARFANPPVPRACRLSFFGGVVGATTNTQLARTAEYQIEASAVEMTHDSPVPLHGPAEGQSNRPSEAAQPAAPAGALPTGAAWKAPDTPAPSAFKSLAVVYDERLPDSSHRPLRYLTTNGPARLEDPGIVRRLAERNLLLASKRSPAVAARRTLVIAALGVITLVPLAIFALRARRKRTLENCSQR